MEGGEGEGGIKRGQVLSILTSLWVWKETLLNKERKKEKKGRKKERKKRKEKEERRSHKFFNNKEFFNFAQNFLSFAIDHIGWKSGDRGSNSAKSCAI